LHQIGRLTDEQVIVARADVILVQPVFGGGGVPNLDYNAACIEAMLANPHENLPEVLRLAWLLSQLQNDLPMFSETINRRRLKVTSGLAMLPAALQAAQELSLTTCDRTTLTSAISGWHVIDGDAAATAEIVDSWWATVLTGGFAWATALQSLDRMLTT
jgi:hypothetical protein